MNHGAVSAPLLVGRDQHGIDSGREAGKHVALQGHALGRQESRGARWIRFSLPFNFNKIGSFVSGSFSVRFFHSHAFSITSPLRFPVRSGSFFANILCFQQLLRFVFEKRYSFLFFERLTTHIVG